MEYGLARALLQDSGRARGQFSGFWSNDPTLNAASWAELICSCGMFVWSCITLVSGRQSRVAVVCTSSGYAECFGEQGCITASANARILGTCHPAAIAFMMSTIVHEVLRWAQQQCQVMRRVTARACRVDRHVPAAPARSFPAHTTAAARTPGMVEPADLEWNLACSTPPVATPPLARLLLVAGVLELLGILGPVLCIRSWLGPNLLSLSFWLPLFGLSAYLRAHGVQLMAVFVAVSVCVVVAHAVVLSCYCVRHARRAREARELPTQMLLVGDSPPCPMPCHAMSAATPCACFTPHHAASPPLILCVMLGHGRCTAAVHGIFRLRLRYFAMHVASSWSCRAD